MFLPNVKIFPHPPCRAPSPSGRRQGLAAIKWIFLIPIPLQGGVDDVFAGAGQFMLVPDNPFVILTLPNRTAGGVADDVDLFG